jgi:hypothetical protein
MLLIRIRFNHTYHKGKNALIHGKYPHIYVEPHSGHLINMINVKKLVLEGPYLRFDLGENHAYHYQLESGEEAKKIYDKIIKNIQ